MSIRLEPGLLSPRIGRFRSIYSGAVELLNPVVAVVSPIPLELATIPVIVSPEIIVFDPVDLELTELPIVCTQVSAYTPVELALTEVQVEIAFISHAAHEVEYGGTILYTHTTSYFSEVDQVYNTHEITWSQLAQQTHTTSWYSDSALSTYSVHDSIYQSSSSLSALSIIHEQSWSSEGLESVVNTHTATWNSFVTVESYQVHDTSWNSSGSLSAITVSHDTSWNSSGSLSTVIASHTTDYQSFILIPGYALHEVSWNSSGATSLVLSVHETQWASVGSTISTTFYAHDSLWKSRSLLNETHTTRYQSVVESFATHTHTWKSFVQENIAIHESRYRSYTMDAQFILANAYIEPDIQILSASITADEDSPYYQCEVELRDAKDYQAFVRDQAFILHLFNDSYHFVVDSKGLSRSIDDEGNYQESATISGLSPLCLKAAPRSTSITKVWDTPQFASVLVEELMGVVTWNLVDWMIPAYRLSADNADPFEIAQNIVQAAGGLIESQPNGSVVVRHRWPISIANLDTGTPDETLTETIIYSAQEQPTQDVLMNRIRITDSNAGYQDRLEYVSNDLNGEDDPWNGILYAYLSPWRENLRIVTTRGSKVQIGNQTESTKQIFNEDDENTAETLTFESGQSSTQYPIMTLDSFEWLDENLGSITFTPYATTLEASDPGSYYGYSLAEIEYTTRRLQVPVSCSPDTQTIEAQFLLLETQNG